MTFLSLPAGVGARPVLTGIAAAADLRACLPGLSFTSGMSATGPFGSFRFDPTSLAADNGVSVIKPNDIAPGSPGRWLLGATPPPAGTGEQIVTNLAALTALAVGTFQAGQAAWVETLDAVWRWSPTPVGAADGITIVPDSAAGQWWRVPSLSQRWAERTSWRVDNAGGNDEGEGTFAQPIRTMAELYRRLAPYGRWVVQAPTAVALVATGTDYVMAEACDYDTSAGDLTFTTAAAPISSDVWALTLARNPAGNVLPEAQPTAQPLAVGNILIQSGMGAGIVSAVASIPFGPTGISFLAAAWDENAFAPAGSTDPTVGGTFAVASQATLRLGGEHVNVTQGGKAVIRSLIVATVGISLARLHGFTVNAAQVQLVSMVDCQAGGSALLGVSLTGGNVQCSVLKNCGSGPGGAAGYVAIGAGCFLVTSGATACFLVGPGSHVWVRAPTPAHPEVASYLFTVLDARLSLDVNDALYGSGPGHTLQIAGTTSLIEYKSGSWTYAPALDDFVYAGFTDQWFPPLNPVGGPTLAVGSFTTVAALLAPPFRGWANHETNETKWRIL